jgi:hypothetical protein
MSTGKSKPPHLPFDVITVIAGVSIEVYYLLLALPRFGRHILSPKARLSYESRFTTYKTEYVIIANNLKCLVEEWYLTTRSGKHYHHHNTASPAYIMYYPDGQIRYEGWYRYGKYHRSVLPDGKQLPARTCWYPLSMEYPKRTINYEEYYQDGQLHRIDGPASISIYIHNNGQITEGEYYLHGIWYNRVDYHKQLEKIKHLQ